MNRNILVVDDEPHVLDGLRRLLGKRFTVTTASGGEEALMIVDARGPFAAVLCDLRMPGIDGLELLTELRARVPSTVRLVLSGSHDFDAAVTAVNDGAIFRFLTKPAPPDVLIEALESAILRYEIDIKTEGSFDPCVELLHEVRILHEGIQNDQLHVFFQPQCNLDSGKIMGAEALVRWKHPRNGLMLPGQFFGTAEAGGLMGDITKWVMEATCRQASAWKKMGMPPLRLSINVSAADLQHPSFITHLSELLDRYDITSEWLEIELTEGVAVQNTESIRNVLENLIRMGITLSIDDFGTGYSQLGWLQQLPFQKLKIDRSFISDIDIRADAFRFLQSIVAMGTECRMEILAEGVETTPQGERAKEAGCVSMQGYLLAKPMPASEFPGWLSAYRK